MSGPDEAEILELERRRTQATNAGDTDALREILDEGYQHITGYGRYMTRDSYIAWVSSAPRVHKRGPISIRRLGDFAILCGDLTNELSRPGGLRVVEAAVLQTAHRQDGRWRMLSFQISVRSDTHPPAPGRS